MYLWTRSHDNSRLCSAGADKIVKLTDVGTGQPIRKLRGHISRINSVKFNEDSTVIVSGIQANCSKSCTILCGSDARFLRLQRTGLGLQSTYVRPHSGTGGCQGQRDLATVDCLGDTHWVYVASFCVCCVAGQWMAQFEDTT
jgi:WD40 repeat protein